MKKRLLFLIMSLLFIGGQTAFSQGSTTASMNGKVASSIGETLPGATVIATHEPSGTRYGTITQADGRFNIPGMRVGGPYKVSVTFVGFSEWQASDVFLNLGENKYLSASLTEIGVQLQEIAVVAKAGSVGQNTGTSTNISSQTIENMPSINRNVNDYIRLTPQASSYGEGISFAGTNNRYNAIYIDGAVNNDVYGLASSGTNGGQTGISPFSIDIIDQLQVVLSPYDVTYGGFAGGGINAVTKSGTNQFKGTGYYYVKNQNLVGKTNGILAERLSLDEREKVADFTETTYGASFGGPIIKDKLFVFANFEIQKDETPTPFDISEYTSIENRASVADLETLRSFLINTYDYDPGNFGNTAQNLDGVKLFAKIDYNIDDNHRLTLRHQYTKSENYERYAGNRNTVNFSNNGFYFPSTTNSSALELNSRFGSDYSNHFILSRVSVRDDRDPIGKDFPYVFIEDGNGIIRFGSEEFSTANRLDQDIITITDNFNIYKGAHTITVGMHNEIYSAYNVFIGQNYGTYRYDSLEAFLQGLPAKEYDRSYSLVDNIAGNKTAAAADFNAMQLGFYIQDEWTVNNNLTLTGGLRFDLPIINTALEVDNYFYDSAVIAMQDQYPAAKGTIAGSMPQGQIMLSPRLGFSYDIFGNGKHIVRGGLGIFTSRIPFVWPGAMYTNNGLTLGRVDESSIDGDIFFNPDVQSQPTNPNFAIPSGQIDIFTKDFKYPQVFRTNLAYDFILPGGIEATIEALYTKTLNNILYTNINSDTAVKFKWTGSPDNRNVYFNKNINSTYSAVYLASNTSEGYTYNLSASFAKKFEFGLSALLAYSYGDAYALSEGTSSQNSSQWRGQVNINGRNNPEYGRSDFAAGHRIVTALTYAYNWTKDGANKTTVSLFMNSQSGTPYSYIIDGSNARNLNAERGSTSANRSLVFIPNDASDINLVDYTSGDVTVTAAEQWTNLNNLIEDDKYLSKNRGKYAEKNGAWAPFTTIFDVAIRHDFGLKFGSNTHKFQLSLDIANVGNMLNKDWGTIYTIPGTQFNNYLLYQFEGYESDGTTPKFTFRNDKTGLDSYGIANFASRWNMLFGVRYIFN